MMRIDALVSRPVCMRSPEISSFAKNVGRQKHFMHSHKTEWSSTKPERNLHHHSSTAEPNSNSVGPFLAHSKGQSYIVLLFLYERQHCAVLSIYISFINLHPLLHFQQNSDSPEALHMSCRTWPPAPLLGTPLAQTAATPLPKAALWFSTVGEVCLVLCNGICAIMLVRSLVGCWNSNEHVGSYWLFIAVPTVSKVLVFIAFDVVLKASASMVAIWQVRAPDHGQFKLSKDQS